jgi:hypothetical protein
VAQGGGVAHRRLNPDPEKVTDLPDIAPIGVDLLEDAVFSQGLGPEAGVGPGELFADRGEPGPAPMVDEQVRVGGGRPLPGAVVEPGGQTDFYRPGEGDVQTIEGEPAVDDVGELQASQLTGGEGVERGFMFPELYVEDGDVSTATSLACGVE